MVVDKCTQYEQNPPICLCAITTNIQNVWNNGDKYIFFAQNQGIFYMHQASIVVDHYKIWTKSTLSSWDISQQTQTIMKQIR